MPCVGICGTATLTWDTNPASERVSKYVIYHATNTASAFVWFGETSTNAFSLPPLRSGSHFFYATAVNYLGLESDPCNQVLVPVPNPPAGLRITIQIP
jgi:hypothetical protein